MSAYDSDFCGFFLSHVDLKGLIGDLFVNPLFYFELALNFIIKGNTALFLAFFKTLNNLVFVFIYRWEKHARRASRAGLIRHEARL
jgi:hypothetical protein